MARQKQTDEIMVSISTRIKHSTMERLDEYCNKNGKVRAAIIDQAINELLDKLEMTN